MSYLKVVSWNLLSIVRLLAATVLLSLVAISQAALYHACNVGNALFEAFKGFNINSVDTHGLTPLMEATHEEIVKKLILAGDNGGKQDEDGDMTIYHAACNAGIRCGTLLAEEGASVRTENDCRKRTAGIEAIPYCSQKYGEVVFFDFAGQLEYHSPHQIFLESLLAELVMPPSTPSSVTAISRPLPTSTAKLVKLSSIPTTISSPPPTPSGFNTVPLNTSRSTVRDMSSKPTVRDVNELVVTPVAAHWQGLALRLGVEFCVIEIIFKNHPNDCEGACLEMFNRWLRGERYTGEEERTWSTLLTALGRAGYKDLESILRKEHFKAEKLP